MAITIYLNFDLLIEPSRVAYRARVLQSPLGEAMGEFILPFRADELDTFLSMLGRLLDGSPGHASSGQVAPLDPQQFGERLFNAVFAGDVGVCLMRSLDEARHQAVGLRIRLRLDKAAPELALLPWEYLYVPYLKRFLALSDQTVLVRYVELAQPVRALRVTPPLKLLGIVANPRDIAPLNVEEEWQCLQQALANLCDRQLVVLERLPSATLVALQDRLRQGDVHLVHYIGHGYFNELDKTGNLVLENAQGQSHLVPARELALLFHDHPALRLIFLNACEGAHSGRTDSFASVAQTFVEQGIPAVLAMQFMMTDTAAITLAHEFYEAVAAGNPVDMALAEARKAVYLLAGARPGEWGTPVLFSRSPDNQLLELPQGDAQPIIPTQPYEPATILIPGSPFLLGSAPDANLPARETPQHTVILPDYRIGKTPVTNRQYAEFLKHASAHPNPPSWFLREPPVTKLEHPVVGVSWYDARAYCVWLSKATGRTYRLPTEAEWEKAARGTDSRRYPWGDEWVDDRCNVGGDDTSSVTAHPAGASPYGCLDMLGNVQEWTNTLWGSDPKENAFPYPYQVDDGREAPDAIDRLPRSYRIYRGGSYHDQPDNVRCSARGASSAASKLAWRGFRVVLVLT